MYGGHLDSRVQGSLYAHALRKRSGSKQEIECYFGTSLSENMVNVFGRYINVRNVTLANDSQLSISMETWRGQTAHSFPQI